MATFVLIPGADGRAWYWHRLVPELHQRGHEAVGVDLPPEGTAGLAEYTNAVVTAVSDAGADQSKLVVVAQSFGAFTGPLVCGQLSVRMLVLLNPMVTIPPPEGFRARPSSLQDCAYGITFDKREEQENG